MTFCGNTNGNKWKAVHILSECGGNRGQVFARRLKKKYSVLLINMWLTIKSPLFSRVSMFSTGFWLTAFFAALERSLWVWGGSWSWKLVLGWVVALTFKLDAGSRCARFAATCFAASTTAIVVVFFVVASTSISGTVVGASVTLIVVATIVVAPISGNWWRSRSRTLGSKLYLLVIKSRIRSTAEAVDDDVIEVERGVLNVTGRLWLIWAKVNFIFRLGSSFVVLGRKCILIPLWFSLDSNVFWKHPAFIRNCVSHLRNTVCVLTVLHGQVFVFISQSFYPNDIYSQQS